MVEVYTLWLCPVSSPSVISDSSPLFPRSPLPSIPSLPRPLYSFTPFSPQFTHPPLPSFAHPFLSSIPSLPSLLYSYTPLSPVFPYSLSPLPARPGPPLPSSLRCAPSGSSSPPPPRRPPQQQSGLAPCRCWRTAWHSGRRRSRWGPTPGWRRSRGKERRGEEMGGWIPGLRLLLDRLCQ